VEFAIARAVLDEGLGPGRIEIDRIQEDVGRLRIELGEDFLDLAFGLVPYPVVDKVETCAVEQFRVVVLLDRFLVGGRDQRLRIDQHQRIGDQQLEGAGIGVDCA
jgi:hypothetical protein